MDRSFSFLLSAFLIAVMIAAPVVPLSAESKLPPLLLIVQETEGTVQVQRDEANQWSALSVDDELEVGDRIRTGEQSSVRFAAPGISSTELGSEADIVIEELSRSRREEQSLFGSRELDINNVSLQAEQGEINSSVRPHEQAETNYEIHTDNAVAGVRGTVFRFERSSDGGVRAGVLRGSVNFFSRDDPNRGWTLEDNQMSQFRPGQNRPDQPSELDPSIRDGLQQFNREAQKELQLPPWLGNFQLAGQSFEESITIVYPEEQSLQLSGTAEAQEDNRTLSSIRVTGGLGEHQFRPDGPTDDWSVTGQPAAPAEGERRVITVQIWAEDSEGIQSPPYRLRITLVHPEEQGSGGGAQGLQREGIQMSPDVMGRPELNDPAVRRAIDRLASARSAFIRRDGAGYLDLFQGLSEIQTKTGPRSFSEFQEGLDRLVPLLGNPGWSMVIEDIAVDDDRIQLTVESSYTGQIVELLGLEPSNPDPDPRNVVRRRPVESLQNSGREIYRFDRTGGGAQLTSARISLFLDQSTLYEADRQRARWQVKNALFGLFYAYEQGSADAVSDRIHPDFLNNDENGFRHGYNDFIDSVRTDLENLYDILFSVRVQSIQFEGTLDRSRVEIEWDRQARLGNTNQLWLSEDHSSVLGFRRSSPYRLARITGDAVMGLSSPKTGSTLIRGGSLDGSEFSPQVVSSSSEVENFSSEEFPELSEEQSTQIASEGCYSGTISSNITSDQTWCETVNVTAAVEIASGVTLTIQDGTTVEFDPSTTLSIFGTLDATGTSFQKAGASQWEGILVKDNATVKISSSTIKGASSATNQALVELEGSGITYESTGNDYLGGNTTDAGVFGMNDGAVNIVFDNDIFKNFTKQGICNSGGTQICGQTFASYGYDIVIKNSDFLGIGSGGANAAISALDHDADGNPSIQLENNYIGGNSGTNCYTTDVSKNDSSGQYFEITAPRVNPRTTPNRAADPGYGPCGV